MNVLHVIPAVAHRYGGPSQAVLGMCSALLARDVSVLIVTTDADGKERLPVVLGRPVSHQGVPAIFFHRQCNEAFKYSWPMAHWMDAHVAEFDVVHIHAVFSHASLAAAAASRRHGVKYVVRPLGSLDPWSMRQKRLQKRLLWHLGVNRMLIEAAAIHYTTAEEQRLAETSLGLGRGVVIPLGVSEELLACSASVEPVTKRCAQLDGCPYVLVLGRLHPKKGLELLLRAFGELSASAEFRDWRLLVAGDGEKDYVASLKRQARNRGGCERVVFAGWVSGKEKTSALRGAALVIMPSRQENFGLTAVEAMACGVPVLVSPHVNLAEEIRGPGLDG